MRNTLLNKKCIPCESGIPPLAPARVQELLKEIDAAWTLVDDGKKIARTFTFKDFMEAMRFVNRLADIAEAEGHHPDIAIFYNKVTLELWTHAAQGLTENDFILAAKIGILCEEGTLP